MSKDKRGNIPVSQLQAEALNPRHLEDLTTKGGRLAFRKEGDFWNCYFALPDTMKGAIFLSSTRIRAAEDPLLRDIFMEYNRTILTVVLDGRLSHFESEQKAKRDDN